MKFIIGLILLASPSVFAKDSLPESKVPVKEGYGTMNMDEFKGLNNQVKMPKSGVTFSQTCKGKSGVEYKATDNGYEACLREAQMDNTINNKNGAQPGMGVHIGN